MPTFIYAFLGGLLPSLLWLWFWLKEDVHPEPKRMIAGAFLAGVIVVPAALFFEGIVTRFIFGGIALFVAWAAIEELLKYAGAYLVAFRGKCLDKTHCIDEPIDPVIYMITVALGFSAAENALFLLTPFGNGEILAGVLTGNLRFIGATVLHTVASATIGIAMGVSYYKSPAVKAFARIIGLFTAIVLHALFNIFILMSNQGSIFLVFGGLWVAVIVLLLVFERIKRMRKQRA